MARGGPSKPATRPALAATPGLKDWHLWSEVARTIAPLRPKHHPKIAARIPSARPAVVPPVAGGPPPPHPYASVSPRGLQPADREPPRSIEPGVRKRLVRGRIQIDATIDLHGMRQIEAHAALHRFIGTALHRGHRTVLVITGKGLKKTGYASIEQQGVLRTRLPGWLAEPDLAPFVAGWEVAAQTHGGEGAYYVRLKAVTK